MSSRIDPQGHPFFGRADRNKIIAGIVVAIVVAATVVAVIMSGGARPGAGSGGIPSIHPQADMSAVRQEMDAARAGIPSSSLRQVVPSQTGSLVKTAERAASQAARVQNQSQQGAALRYVLPGGGFYVNPY